MFHLKLYYSLQDCNSYIVYVNVYVESTIQFNSKISNENVRVLRLALLLTNIYFVNSTQLENSYKTTLCNISFVSLVQRQTCVHVSVLYGHTIYESVKHLNLKLMVSLYFEHWKHIPPITEAQAYCWIICNPRQKVVLHFCLLLKNILFDSKGQTFEGVTNLIMCYRGHGLSLQTVWGCN